MIKIKQPENLKYQDNTWIKTEGEEPTIGIIKSSADAAKEFVFIQLPKLGPIKKGEILVGLEAMKWSGEIESPINGEIIEINNKLFDEPSIINQDPYGEGWIAKIKIKK